MKLEKSQLSLNIKSAIKKYPRFYQKVWLACAAIPYGETRSYQWIAQKIGHKNAYRAVGSALKKNPFAPRIPCHRVVCSNGSLGDYSGTGGKNKKRLLLQKEQKKTLS